MVKRTVKRPRKKTKKEQNIVSYFSKSLLPYPERYRAKFHCDIAGYFPASLASTTQYFVQLNGLFHPFASGGWPNALPLISTVAPMGLSNLLNSAYYTRYRVLGAKISFAMQSASVGDNFQVTITPGFQNNLPATTYTAMTIPFNKQKVFTQAQSQSPLTHYITQHELLGVRKQAIEDDLSGNYQGSAGTNCATSLYYVINVSCLDQTTTAAKASYICRMTYYAELWGNANQEATET